MPYFLLHTFQLQEAPNRKWETENATKQPDFHNDLPGRTSRLLQHINEAMWRYEVVHKDIFQKRLNLIDKHRTKPHLLQSQHSTSSSGWYNLFLYLYRINLFRYLTYFWLKKQSISEVNI